MGKSRMQKRRGESWKMKRRRRRRRSISVIGGVSCAPDYCTKCPLSKGRAAITMCRAHSLKSCALHCILQVQCIRLHIAHCSAPCICIKHANLPTIAFCCNPLFYNMFQFSVTAMYKVCITYELQVQCAICM